MSLNRVYENIEDMRKHKQIPFSSIIEMKQLLDRDPDKILNTAPGVPHEYRDRRIQRVNDALIQSFAQVNNIYDSIDSLEKWIDAPVPERIGGLEVLQWKYTINNAALWMIGSGIIGMIGYAFPYTSLMENPQPVETLLYAGSLFCLFQSATTIRERLSASKNEKVKSYRQDLYEYNELEIQASHNIKTIRKNLKNYVENMEWMENLYSNNHSHLSTTTEKEFQFYLNGIRRLNGGIFNRMIKSVEDKKLGKIKFYEHNDPKLFVRKFYHPSIKTQFKKKELDNMNIAKLVLL